MLNGTVKIRIDKPRQKNKNNNTSHLPKNRISEKELDDLIELIDNDNPLNHNDVCQEIRENPGWFYGNGHLRNNKPFINYLTR